MPFKDDVFVSYASEDKAWADQLSADLRARNLEVYLDRERLKGGLNWTTQLADGLEGARLLVVLGSANARASDWVNYERVEFQTFKRTEEILRRQQPPGPADERRIIPVNLEGSYAPDSRLEGSDVIAKLGGYAAGPIGLTGDLLDGWNRAVQLIYDAARNVNASKPIAATVVAMTKAECLGLNPATTRGLDHSLNDLLDDLGLASLTQLSERYGATELDWRPFNGQERIADLMARLGARVSNKIGPHRWDYVDLFNGPLDDARKAFDRLHSGRSVIVIDPLSLYLDRIHDRFGYVKSCLRNPDAVVAVLGACPASPTTTRIRAFVKKIVDPDIEPYFDPPVPAIPFATCGPAIHDEADFDRLVLSSVTVRDAFSRPADQLFTTMGHV